MKEAKKQQTRLASQKCGGVPDKALVKVSIEAKVIIFMMILSKSPTVPCTERKNSKFIMSAINVIFRQMGYKSGAQGYKI